MPLHDLSSRMNLHGLPPSVWERLESVLKRFESSWRAGARPALEDFLPADGPERQALLVELIRLDLRYRFQAGESISLEPYLKRYAELQAVPHLVLELIRTEQELCQPSGTRAHLTPDQAQRLRPLCDRFQQGWLAGLRPPLEDLLDEVGKEDRALLLRELLLVEIRCRERLGEAPRLTEYQARLPEHHDVLRHVFDTWRGQVTPTKSWADRHRALPQADETDWPHLPDYQLLEILGRGGMGIVYRARHLKLGRMVALKMIARRGADGPEPVRFQTEAQALARLGHPNIVQIFEVGEHNGQPFFAMELVEGGGLDRRLNGQPQEPRQAAVMVEVLARAMHCAHGAGVIHRDLKPANVLVTPEGVLKVADFGLAKHLDAESGQTRPGEVMGTPSYMAPEQTRGAVAAMGPTTDVYSLGAILYECLTGRPPFRGPTVLDTLEQVRQCEPLPVRQLQPSVPRDLETVCLKCLKKDPRKRYETAAALAEDLRRWLDGLPVRARPIGPLARLGRWCRREPRLAATVALVAGLLLSLVGVLAVSANRQNRLTEQARQEADNTQQTLEKLKAETRAREEAIQAREQTVEKLANESRARAEAAQRAVEESVTARYSHQLALAQLAMLAHDPGEADRLLASCAPNRRGWEWSYLRHQLAQQGQVLRSSSPILRVAFSPDGRRLASTGEGDTRLWDVQTGREVHRLPRGPIHVFSLAFRPASQQLATASQEVEIWDTDSGKRLFALPGQLHTDFRRIRCLAFSSDGLRLAGGAEDGVHVWDLATRKVLRVLRLPAGSLEPADVTFSPDGTQVAATCADRVIRLWSLADDKPARIFGGFSGPALHVRFLDAGKTLFGVGYPGEIRRWHVADGRALEGLALPSLPEGSGFVLSPDGAHMACWSGRGVLLIDARTGKVVGRLRGHLGPLNCVTWSLDGRRIASGASDSSIRIWPLSGPAETLLPRLPFDGRLAACAIGPDRRLIAFSGFGPLNREDQGGWALWDPTLGRARLERRGREVEVPERLLFSANGRSLVSASWPKEKDRTFCRIRWLDAEGTRGIILERNIPSQQIPLLQFDPDGGQLACLSLQTDPGPGPLQARIKTKIVVLNGAEGREVLSTLVSGHALGAGFREKGKVLVAVLFDPEKPGARTEVKAFDLVSGKLVESVKLRGTGPSPVIFSPDGNSALAIQMGSHEAELRLLDARTGLLRATLTGHQPGPPVVRFSPDGQRIVAYTGDSVTLWDSRTGQSLLRLDLNLHPLLDLAFSADGHRLTAIDQEGQIQVWDYTEP